MLTREQHEELSALFDAYGAASFGEGLHFGDADKRERQRAEANAAHLRFFQLLRQLTDPVAMEAIVNEQTHSPT